MQKGYDNENKGYGVLVIYTGGTIGSMPKDMDDPDSPQVVVDWQTYKKLSPELEEEKLKFNVDAYSTEPLDSCNIGPFEWREMAKVIFDSYQKYEGFVILHGTDTMVYTASALSFMLQNLSKPVVITGAQMSYLFNVRNDGLQNMISALHIANPSFSKIPTIPEVCIYFGGKVLRGNRAKKLNASGFDAYNSPNFKYLAVVGESILVDTNILRKPNPSKLLTLKSKLETNVVAINFFPGIQDGRVLEGILKDDKLKGVVLMAYGAGNIPTKKEVLDLIKEGTNKGVVFLNVTQCGGGKVELGMYDTSAKLIDVGVVSGVDITSEAALVKLMVLLGDEDLTPHQVALEVQKNIAGEQSISIYTTEFASGNNKLSKDNSKVRIPATNIDGYESIKEKDVDKIILRLKDTRIRHKNTSDHVELSIFMDVSSEDVLSKDSPNFVGSFRKLPNDEHTVSFFDITQLAKKVINARASFTILLETTEAEMEWSSAELTIFTNE